MQRYFRSEPAVYEAIRSQLDAAWGLPNDKGTVTCIEPAETAFRDGDGMVLLAVRSEFCEFPAVSSMLPTLLASGSVEEINAAEYHAAFPPSDGVS
jgi:hypothetical protein